MNFRERMENREKLNIRKQKAIKRKISEKKEKRDANIGRVNYGNIHISDEVRWGIPEYPHSIPICGFVARNHH